MSNILSLSVVCKKHKKPCNIIGMPGFKKIDKQCCEEILNVSTHEANIINGVIHI